MSHVCKILRRIIFFLLHLSFTWSPLKAQQYKINVQGCGISQPLPRIIHGSAFVKTQVPWLVQIARVSVDRRVVQCSGSIITRNVILTAAHCVQNRTFNPKGKIAVFYNSTKVFTPPYILVKRGVVHRLYKQYPKGYDIALLKLTKPLPKFDSFVRPVCLPRQGAKTPTKNMLLAGYGALNYEKKKATEALYIITKAMTKKDCMALLQRHKYTIPVNRMFCTNHPRGTAYVGDSGAGLTAHFGSRQGSKSVQFGIASFVWKRHNGLAPNVFTRVSMFMKWITKSLENMGHWKKLIESN